MYKLEVILIRLGRNKIIKISIIQDTSPNIKRQKHIKYLKDRFFIHPAYAKYLCCLCREMSRGKEGYNETENPSNESIVTILSTICCRKNI